LCCTRPWERGRRNNIIHRGDDTWGAHGSSVSLDPGEASFRKRYKMIFDCRSLLPCIAVSADGIYFESINGEEPVLTPELKGTISGDTYNQLVHDPARNRYLIYTRRNYATCEEGWREVRGHAAFSSPTLEGNWTLEREWFLDREGPEEKDVRQLYSLTASLYQGVYFGLATVLLHPRDIREGGVDLKKRHERDTRESYLVVSSNGLDWDLSSIYEGRPVIDRGGDGAWDKDQIMTTPTIVEFQGKHWLFYMGIDERHDCESPDKKKQMGAATIPLGRLVYLTTTMGTGTTAKEEEKGYVETVLLRFPPGLSGLVLDIDTGGVKGTASVELLHPNGLPVEGFGRDAATLITNADGGDIVSLWGGRQITEEGLLLAGLDIGAGAVARLRFHLTGGARLFSFAAHVDASAAAA